jgi:hypothetical protein
MIDEIIFVEVDQFKEVVDSIRPIFQLRGKHNDVIHLFSGDFFIAIGVDEPKHPVANRLV